MEKQIEVEVIGNLTIEKFIELKKKLENKGRFKKRKKRISFMYFRDRVPKNISEIKGEDTDLRLRITNKEPELIIKKGIFTGSHCRKEISIHFPLKEIQKYVDFLSAIGWNIGIIYAIESYVYDYQGVEISLIDIKDYGYNFEAEILSTNKEKENNRDKISKILSIDKYASYYREIDH